MIKSSLFVGGVAALVAGAVVAPAAADASGIPGAGYLASPTTFKTAKVTLRVPKVACSSTSPTRTVELGLFATRTSAGHPTPVGFSLTVEAACTQGRTHYRAVYRNGITQVTAVHAGDSVRLILDGANWWEVDDITTGSGAGGGTASGGGGDQPKAGRHVLIGAETVGASPHGVRTVFHDAIVNHVYLSKVAHHRQGRGEHFHVGSLHDNDFQVTVV